MYTLVIGVDRSHLDQLQLVWPTWMKNKPSMRKHRVVCFYDRLTVQPEDLYARFVPMPQQLTLQPWPPLGVLPTDYGAAAVDKWSNPQRAMMLSGFIAVAAATVQTPYWLKLDLDVVATGKDNWIDSHWFETNPSMVSHPWGYTKPPDQILKLDAWVERHKNKPGMSFLAAQPPLNLVPNPGSSMVKHKRIISWCAFFNTQFTKLCSSLARETCLPGTIPVPSQDGFMFYVAKRLGYEIPTVNMKRRGWEHHNGTANVRKAVERALNPVKAI